MVMSPSTVPLNGNRQACVTGLLTNDSSGAGGGRAGDTRVYGATEQRRFFPP
jgi:hypothetical protein